MGSLGADFMIWLRISRAFCLGKCWLSTSMVVKSPSPTQNNHKTQHITHATTNMSRCHPTPSGFALSLHSNIGHGPKSRRGGSPWVLCRLPVWRARSRRSFSLVWGAKMASIKKEWEGRDLDFRWPSLDGGIQLPTKGWHQQRIRGGGNGALGNNKGVGCFPIIGGVEQTTEKLK